MYSLVFILIPAIAITIIGVVMAPKAGAAKGKMWLGLILLIAGSLVSVVWQAFLVAPGFMSAVWDRGGAATIGAIGIVIGLISSVFFVLGVYFLCSAVVMGRQEVAYLDPSRPGAPPTGYSASGYQGSGYQPTGEQPPPQPGTNPYA